VASKGSLASTSAPARYHLEAPHVTKEEYVGRVLAAYRSTPGTTGTVRPPDRFLAAQLYERGVPLVTVENALVLAAARRLIRPADAPPLPTVRSLAYFASVIDEVSSRRVSPDYFRYLRQKVERYTRVG
jgi:hypothetical protein